MRDSLLPLVTLLTLGGDFAHSKARPRESLEPSLDMSNWGRRKRERYAELINDGMSPQNAFDVVENHRGIIPEKDTL